MIAAVQNAAEGKADAAKWRLEAARGRARMLATRDGYLQASCAILKDRIAASKANLALVERKVRTAAPNSRLRQEDLDKIEKIANDRKKAAEKEIAAVSKRLKTAMANRTQAQTALDALLATATQGKEPEGLELAKFRVEVAEGRIESLQSMIENLESLVQLENVNIKSHQDRFAILTASDPAARAKALESITANLRPPPLLAQCGGERNFHQRGGPQQDRIPCRLDRRRGSPVCPGQRATGRPQ